MDKEADKIEANDEAVGRTEFALLCVGDLVRPKSNKHILASGCSRYDFAVVVRMEPFTLVSEHADMMWSCTVQPENFEAFGVAKLEMLEKCSKRL